MNRARASVGPLLAALALGAGALPLACGTSAPPGSAGAPEAGTPEAEGGLDGAVPSRDASLPESDGEAGPPDAASVPDAAAEASAGDASTLDATADAETGGDAATRAAAYICAPATRALSPVAVFTTSGTVTDPTNVLSGKTTALTGSGSYVVLDFGTEVGGLVTLTFSAASDASQSIALAFSESSLYAGPTSDQSNGSSGTPDGAIAVAVPGSTTYTMPAALLRGGFRYLTVALTSAGWVHLDGVSLAYSPDPERAVPNQYPNYFYSNDDVLNRAWYAGAYTLQTNIVRGDQGRAWPPPASGWNNANVVGESGPVCLVDGAKRDRTVWPGDMGISLPTAYASLFDTLAAKGSLETLFNHQDGQGQLPFAGPQVNAYGSDTYHMWTLLGVYLEYLYSGDRAFLDGLWPKFKLGMTYITSKVDANGLLNVTGLADWARDGQQGENIEANALLYGLLVRAASLAQVEGDAATAATYTSLAATLKTKANAALWDSAVGAFKDNPSSTLHPQDGNALAAWFGLVGSATQARGLSYVLNENWNAIGSRGPEFTRGTGAPLISPFAGSMELMSHFAVGYDTRALDLIRSMWGFMLDSPLGTGCTFWEGFTSAGAFAYDGPYTSLSHGWSTGPTSALTFYVLGVAPDAASGAAYHVVPHPGDLAHVEGSLTMAPGESVAVSYDVGAACQTFTLHVDASALAGSAGTIAVPRFGATHAVQVDGSVAWDGSSFVATPGIAGATQDADYISFNGVQPAAHTFAYTDGTACPPAPEEWSFCADENGTCSFTGTKRVRFGKQGKYDYAILTGGTPCALAAFGPDPIPGTLKSCQISDELFTVCAPEGGTCVAGAASTEVRFGANGQWSTRPVSGGASVPCDVTTFGDPIMNVVKRCEIR